MWRQAILTQLASRIEDGKSTDAAGDALVALHCAAAIGDNERARNLIEPAGKRAPLVKVDAADSLGRTALHWACFLSMQNAADFLIGQGADPEKRASAALDHVWCTGVWDSRLRTTGDGGGRKMLPTTDGTMIGPTPLELCFQLHAARVLVKGSVDIAMDRREEDDFVGASARFAACHPQPAYLPASHLHVCPAPFAPRAHAPCVHEACVREASRGNRCCSGALL